MKNTLLFLEHPLCYHGTWLYHTQIAARASRHRDSLEQIYAEKVRVKEGLHRLSREAVDSSYLEKFKARLDRALGSLI